MRDNRGRWLKGYAPNPGGRPFSIDKMLAKVMGEHGEKILNILYHVLEKGYFPDPPGTITDNSRPRIPTVDDAVRIQLGLKLLFRQIGEAPREITVNANNAPQWDLDALTVDELRDMLRLAEKAAKALPEGSISEPEPEAE